MKKLLSILTLSIATILISNSAQAEDEYYAPQVRDLPSSNQVPAQYSNGPMVHTRTETTYNYGDIRNDKYSYLVRDIRPEFYGFLYRDSMTQNVTRDYIPGTGDKSNDKGNGDGLASKKPKRTAFAYVPTMAGQDLKLILNDRKKSVVRSFPQ